MRSLLGAFFIFLLAFPPGVARASGLSYLFLSDAEKKLIIGYCGKNPLPGCWDSLTYESQVEFHAIAHAMESRVLEDGTSALDQVEAVQGIQASDPKLPSAEQFNLKVVWKPGAKKLLRKEGHFHARLGLRHPGERGIGENRSGLTGLHLLFDKENDGHIHIDFRKSGFFSLLGHLLHINDRNSHFQPDNANVLSGDQLKTYEAWYGTLPGVSIPEPTIAEPAVCTVEEKSPIPFGAFNFERPPGVEAAAPAELAPAR